MDTGGWIHGYVNNTSGGGNNGFMCGYAAVSSCTPAELQYREEEEQQFLISSQIQHHLNQISMRMNMDDEASVYVPSSNDGGVSLIGIHSPIIVDGLLDPHHHAGSFPSSSSSSSLSLPSASLSCSPESSSAHVLAAPAATTTACSSQYLEVSSQVPLPPPAVPYGDHQYANLHVPAPAHHDVAAAMAPPELPPATNAGGAFRRYARHLGPKRPPKPGACGQRMFKTAMAVLSKMHVAARYNQQYYYQQAAAAAEAAPPPSVNQLQHMFSERKRREKLNDSFHALKTVLPPGAKKDKTSILIRAREYVRSLESKVSELEEKNRSLESRLLRGEGSGRKDAGSGGNDCSGDEKVQVEIARATKEERAAEPCADDLCTLKIVVRSPCNMTDMMLRTLQCLRNQIGDGVSLVAMSTSDSATGVNTCPRPVLTLQIKSPPGARWEEQPVKDAVAKVVADALTTTTTPSAAAQ
ncbi:hypothetical protein SEVIR_5G136900v4 [Setaria viridis]|uniref:BHLH domain-containing protein n=1 Tax=Setaria viridis TaxID=4556 RepID=A0A4U6UD97_SETVI|nr:putative transcription factor bHLH041 [Setaria viridis]TKW13981.1 hypothetical protein SEVIR_5G136900v2 [Setaria viridis]